jgi:hypothetical protein
MLERDDAELHDQRAAAAPATDPSDVLTVEVDPRAGIVAEEGRCLPVVDERL